MELSVVVPVYNVDKYLERCVKSILEQSYKVDEIICVDDGSTDNSAAILDDFHRRYSNIKVIHKSNGGLVSARKAGLQLAAGKYVSYVDSDDWIEKDMYRELMHILKSTEADMVTSGCIRDYGSHVVMEKEHIPAGSYEDDKLKTEIWERMIDTDVFFRSNVSIHIYNKIYKRELLVEHQMSIPDAINVGEDAACVYPCLLNAKKIAVSGKAFYHYCIRNNSIMGNRRKDETERIAMLIEHLSRSFRMKCSDASNLMWQLTMLESYILLLQNPIKVIKNEQDVLFPFGKVKKNDRIVIYGSGRFGVALKDALCNMGYKNIVAWVDKKGDEQKNIKQSSFLSSIEFDKVIIAVLLADVAEEINAELGNNGVEREKILCVSTQMLRAELNNLTR